MPQALMKARFLVQKVLSKEIYVLLRYGKFIILLLPNYVYDAARYIYYSATTNPYNSKQRYQGRIIAHYHVIEKGLSLREPRIGFGTQVVNALVSLLQDYQKLYGLDEVGQVALNVLFDYYQFNYEQGLDKRDLYIQLTNLRQTLHDTSCTLYHQGGRLAINKHDIERKAKINFKDFVTSRHSIRHFASNGDVNIKLIEDAVSMAIQTPSVCNRQAWKVHLVNDPEQKQRVLNHQEGNRGFGETANVLLIVTVDLNYFIGVNERNQGFIDGGMFSMTLVYALHSLGLGTCCLNWSVNYNADIAIRKEIDIEDSENIIMLIAVGYLPEKLQVACSSRRTANEVLVHHK